MLRGGRSRGAATWRRAVWARHVAQQPEHMPCQLCIGVAGRRRCAGAELLLVLLISEGLEMVVGLLVGEEEEQVQEFSVDAVPGRHACRQESHL